MVEKSITYRPGIIDNIIQIKLGGTSEEIEQAATKMADLENKLSDKYPKPSFHMVLTGANNIAYRRDDGLYVVPIGCLKP